MKRQKNRMVCLPTLAITLFSISMCACLQGCSGGTFDKETQKQKENAGKDVQTIDEEMVPENAGLESNNGKGRYLEEELSVLEGYFSDLYLLEDKTLQVFDKSKKQLLTSNTEKTEFKGIKPDFVDDLRISYIDDIAYDKNGNAIVAYLTQEDEEKLEKEDSPIAYSPEYAYISKDGSITELKLARESGWFLKFAFSQDGTVIGYTTDSVLYEINPADGSFRELFQMNQSVAAFAVIGHTVIAMDQNTICFYDLNSREKTENPAGLTEFMESQRLDRSAGTQDYQSCIFAPGEEGIIYLVTKNGLYRYILGGKSIEQIIDGSLNTIGNPSYSAKSLIWEEEGSFLVFYAQGKLVRYTYDSGASAIPDHKLTVYSLSDNPTIRQAISEYQVKFPECYVEYEIGINGNDQKTYDDALKKLNTQILAGNGPDVLVLDEMPMETYIKKGVLDDLSSYQSVIDPDGVLLKNLTESLRTQEGLYAMPARVKIPILAAKEEVLEGITDLRTLTDAVETAYAEKADGKIIRAKVEEEVLWFLFDFCPKELSNVKSINQKDMVEFLSQAKKIYEAATAGLTKEEQEEYRGTMEKVYADEVGANMEKWRFSPNGMELAAGYTQIEGGAVCSFSWEYETITSAKRMDNTLGYQNGIQKGDQSFLPSCILGISSVSKQKDTAVQFLSVVFSKEVQTAENDDGFPVNTQALQYFYERSAKLPDDRFCGIGMSDGSGSFSFQVHYLNEEESARFDKMIRSLQNPFIFDAVTRDTILSIAPGALNGKISIEEAADEICNKINLKRAE